MSPEDRSLLERTYKMVEENNEILKSIRRASRWSMALKVFYWVIILGLSFGAYYFIQPYIESLLGMSGVLKSNVNDVQSVASQINDLLK